MSDRKVSPWLAGYAWVVVAATLVLISIGGLVTSKGVGMAVPDWPTTYGYNMFFFPIDQWTGGIFHEHLHRLVASGVGLLTLLLAVGVQWMEPRPWVRRLAWVALILVVVQGGLGGLRVRLNDHLVFTTTLGTVFGLVHATLAQLFFAVLTVVALVLLPAWHRSPGSCWRLPSWVSKLTMAVLGLMILQLIVAATMRHQHAGLAVPDFPLAYGQFYPPTDPEFLSVVNARRMDYLHDAKITAFQVHIHMVHRILAVLLVVGVCRVSWELIKAGKEARKWGIAWVGLLLVQFCLGIATVLSNKAADFATAHVATGAVSLVSGVSLVLWMGRRRAVEPEPRGRVMVAQGASVPTDARGVAAGRVSGVGA